MKRLNTDYIVLCHSDTPPEVNIGLRELDSRDRKQGWFRCVYHFVIRRDGEIEKGRDWTEPAMSLHKWNASSVTICLVGGQGDPCFTAKQVASLKDLLGELQMDYPDARVLHHHELNMKIRNHGIDLISLTKEITL